MKSDERNDYSLQEVGKQKNELKSINVNSSNYVLGDVDTLIEKESSATLCSLLKIINPALTEAKVHMVNSILLQQFTQAPTALQVFLSVYLRDITVEKFTALHKMGVLFSFDELKRFKSSAAHFTAGSAASPTLPLTDKLVQFIIDNFDLHLNTPTGKKQTHSLASILVRDGELGEEKLVQLIPRLGLTDSRKKIPCEVDIHRYTGPKAPCPPSFTSKITEIERYYKDPTTDGSHT